jgi:hypothetical protein
MCQIASASRVRRHSTLLDARAVLAKQIEVQSSTAEIQANVQHDVWASLAGSDGDSPETATKEALLHGTQEEL